MAFDRKEYYRNTKQKQLERVKAWKDANKERANATSNRCRKNRRLRDPIGHLLAQTRDRAKQHDIPFDLTVEDIVIPEVCPMLGIPLFFIESGTIEGKNPNSPSVDRIIPVLGYVKGNILICSWRANQIKSDATSEELMKIATFLKSLVD